MAIDHDSRSKELCLKNRRAKGGSDGGHEPEEDKEAAAADAEAQQEEVVSPDGERWPPWLRPLLSAGFYTHCEAHSYSRRAGERTMFCLDCAAAGSGALCGLCLAHGHRGHRAIQIRRSSYCNVIRVSDIRGLLDIEGVQTYVINGARVVFLNERPQAQQRHTAAVAKLCECCRRALLDNLRFCSLGCKFAATTSSHGGNTTSSSPPPSLPNAVTQISTPPLLPPIPPAKRRKGIPRRAPFGNLIVD